jgi:hypothetical protein
MNEQPPPPPLQRDNTYNIFSLNTLLILTAAEGLQERMLFLKKDILKSSLK